MIGDFKTFRFKLVQLPQNKDAQYNEDEEDKESTWNPERDVEVHLCQNDQSRRIKSHH